MYKKINLKERKGKRYINTWEEAVRRAVAGLELGG